jgi:hypothetical protein
MEGYDMIDYLSRQISRQRKYNGELIINSLVKEGKEKELLVGEVRDEKYMEEILDAMSTSHTVKDLDHRELLFEVIRENPDKYGISLEQTKKFSRKLTK